MYTYIYIYIEREGGEEEEERREGKERIEGRNISTFLEFKNVFLCGESL